MARSSQARVLKPKNNNYQRKRLKLHTSKKQLLSESCKRYRKRDRRFKLNIAILGFAALFAMGFNYYNTNNQLKSKKIVYNNLDSQYVSYELTRDRLKTNLEKAIDIKEIQRYALEELGMVYADEENTVIVNVNR